MSKDCNRYCWGCEREHRGFYTAFPIDEKKSGEWVDKWNETFATERKRVENIRICTRWYLPASVVTKRGQKRTTIPTFIQGMDGKSMDLIVGSERDIRKKEVEERRKTNEQNNLLNKIQQAQQDKEYYEKQLEATQNKLKLLSPQSSQVQQQPIFSPSMLQPLLPSPLELETNNRLAHYFYVDNLEVINKMMQAIKKQSGYKGKKIALDRLILLTLWRLTEAKEFTELADCEKLDRTNISRQMHKILPSLSKYVYNEYTARVEFPANENQNKFEQMKLPPICSYYMRGTNYFLDDSTYVYLEDVPQNFDSNRALFDSHKETHTIRFYNVCHPTGHHICFFGPNDAQSEDYIVRKFYEEDEYFRSIVDNLKCKISDRGFNRVIESRDWSRRVGLTVH